MNLPTITNAPRELPLSGAIFRARTLTLADLGELLAWLEDRLPSDDGPVRFGSDAARLALASTEGLAVVLHLACASCHPGMTRTDARTLAASMSPADSDRLMAIAFRRRPMPPSDGEGPAKDITELDWGLVWEGLSQHRADRYEAVGRLTLDQYDNVAARGELGGPDTLSPAEVQAMWEKAQAEPEPIPEVLP